MKLEIRYTVPLLALSTLTVAFFLTGRFRSLSPRVTLSLRILAAAPLLASGTLHLMRPEAFVSLLPPQFPQQAWLIVATGIPELLGAIGLLVPRTSRIAAICLAIFMIAIFPANVYVAGQTVQGIPMPGVPVRTTMQAFYIALLLVAGWGIPTRIKANQPG